METKLHRIKKAIAWLHSKEIITKQKDVAAAMQMNVSSLSRALNGDEQYLTDSFLEKFNRALERKKRAFLIFLYKYNKKPPPTGSGLVQRNDSLNNSTTMQR